MDSSTVITWSPWVPLQGCWRGTTIPAEPGLYRIRWVGIDSLHYLGQTGSGGMTLRKRLGMLSGVYAAVMPYRDPHTAGPGLWALRHRDACEFEVSVAPVVGSTAWRLGLEAVAIAEYRQAYGQSPTINFGGMPAGYAMSSSNNALLAKTGRRLHGGPSATSDSSHLPSIPPMGSLVGDVYADDWCGHKWSQWMAIGKEPTALSGGAVGLYRVRVGVEGNLAYIGQGAILSRLASRRQRIQLLIPEGAHDSVECSWVENGSWQRHQRLELENDLIAAHILTIGEPPPLQFMG